MQKYLLGWKTQFIAWSLTNLTFILHQPHNPRMASWWFVPRLVVAFVSWLSGCRAFLWWIYLVLLRCTSLVYGVPWLALFRCAFSIFNHRAAAWQSNLWKADSGTAGIFVQVVFFQAQIYPSSCFHIPRFAIFNLQSKWTDTVKTNVHLSFNGGLTLTCYRTLWQLHPLPGVVCKARTQESDFRHLHCYFANGFWEQPLGSLNNSSIWLDPQDRRERL